MWQASLGPFTAHVSQFLDWPLWTGTTHDGWNVCGQSARKYPSIPDVCWWEIVATQEGRGHKWSWDCQNLHRVVHLCRQLGEVWQSESESCDHVLRIVNTKMGVYHRSKTCVRVDGVFFPGTQLWANGTKWWGTRGGSDLEDTTDSLLTARPGCAVPTKTKLDTQSRRASETFWVVEGGKLWKIPVRRTDTHAGRQADKAGGQKVSQVFRQIDRHPVARCSVFVAVKITCACQPQVLSELTRPRPLRSNRLVFFYMYIYFTLLCEISTYKQMSHSPCP